MVGRHHHLNGCKFEQTPGDSEGQGSLACCSPQGLKEMDTTEQLNNKLYKQKRGKSKKKWDKRGKETEPEKQEK